MAIKISWPGVLAVGAVCAIISFIVHMLGAMTDMAYYMDSTYFPVWSNLMMPTAGPPPIEFTAISLVFSFISGLLFALVYIVVKGSVPGKGWKNKGLMYGFLVFLIAGIPSTMSMLLLINLPPGLLLSWMLQSLVVYLLVGLVAARILK